MSKKKKLYFAVDNEKDNPLLKLGKKKLHWFTKLMIFADIMVVLCFVMAYGPFPGFRNFLVPTALTTKDHRYFAYILYSDEYVKRIAADNVILTSGDKSDNTQIKFVEYGDDVVYSNAYEKQILEKEEGNDIYKIIHLDEDNYTGFITVIYKPEYLDLVITNSKYGETVRKMANRVNATVAINAGGAKVGENGERYAYSIVISNHEVYFDSKKNGEIIGMNDDGILMLYKGTADQAVDAGMKWGIEFGPFLVVNGQATTFKGNGGYGWQPRSAIGQRKDGIILLVTIDGRGANNSKGMSMPELTDLFVRYGAYNAANLDGGGSTTLVENNKVLNNPRSLDLETKEANDHERRLMNAIVLVIPDEE